MEEITDLWEKDQKVIQRSKVAFLKIPSERNGEEDCKVTVKPIANNV